LKFALTSFVAALGGAAAGNTRKRSMAAAMCGLPSVLPRMAIILAAAAIAMTGAGPLWRILQPAEPVTVLPAPAAPSVLAGALQARHLFGTGAGSAAGFRSRNDLRLAGTVTGEGLALIAADGQAPHTYRVGGEIAPGVRLAAVGVRTVEVDRQGVRESLPLAVGHLPAPQR